ncbi:MAG: hypothetical protein OEX12_07090 [Gammaproteobacteria bacterium]|nr:hypothetical protein [Gammaproteobacteria bacterium]
MGRKISNIILALFVCVEWLLKGFGALMDLINFPEAATKIKGWLVTPDGSIDYIAISFWVGLGLLLIINWSSLKKLWSNIRRKLSHQESEKEVQTTNLEDTAIFYKKRDATNESTNERPTAIVIEDSQGSSASNNIVMGGTGEFIRITRSKDSKADGNVRMDGKDTVCDIKNKDKK